MLLVLPQEFKRCCYKIVLAILLLIQVSGVATIIASAEVTTLVKVTTITLPSSATSIGSSAFSYSSKYVKCNLSGSVTVQDLLIKSTPSTNKKLK